MRVNDIKRWAILATVLLAGCTTARLVPDTRLSPGPVEEIPYEMRGVWVSRFDWIRGDVSELPQRIKNIMAEASAANLNAVFFQVRGQAETLYPSPLEPWSKLLDSTDPGFDPVAIAVEEAHRHGLEFHAYINMLPMWNEDTPPADPEHLYYKHGPQTGPDSTWVCYSRDGQPMQLNEYYYMNPALPEVKSYMKEVIRHFVEKYNIDGIHFDRIRYPGSDYLYDPYSVAQFQADSLTSPISRGDWARTQLTDLVEDVVAEALLIKPYLKISSATWGLFRTDDVPGYEHFNSGYDHYYQDAIGWLDRGIMDFIVPMVYWDIPEPKPNFHELWLDFRTRTPNYRNIFPGIRARGELIDSGEIARQVAFLRRNDGQGHVFWSYSSVSGNGRLNLLKDRLYLHEVDLPPDLKRSSPEGVVALKLRSEEGEPLAGERIFVENLAHTQTTDSEGWLSLILPGDPGSIELRRGDSSMHVNIRRQNPPYRFVLEPDGSIFREAPWVEFRRMPSDTTGTPIFHLLCKTDYPATALINDRLVKTYRTGIFFDTITLKEGANRVRVQVITPDSSSVLYEREFFYQDTDDSREPFPLWIDTGSILPAVDHELNLEDMIRVSFVGSKGQKAYAQIRPGREKVPLSREDFEDYSRYSTDLTLGALREGRDHHIRITLEAAVQQQRGARITQDIPTNISIRDKDDFPLVRTIRTSAIMRYNLGEIRLGGPIIAEYPTGVILAVSGRVGDRYRINLNSSVEGYVSQRDVEVLPEGTARPSYFITSVGINSVPGADIVSIPYPEPVPYAVYPDPENKTIAISLYGVMTSSTWMTHRGNRKVIDRVTWKQITPDTYQLVVHLKTSKIWGYELVRNGASLRLSVKHPPILFENREGLPLRGLKIAIEAGHGGRSLGAVGLSGLEEKSVNLEVALELERICLSNQVEVIQVRSHDTDMAVQAKRDSVENSDADLLISIHANSGGSSRGYLAVGGASTYYHNPFWAEFAQIVYRNLLELGLDEFGVVGSFNYTVTRTSSRPAILVEQAFLSHAGDEENLASPEFRRRLAQKVFDGIVEYVLYMRSDPRPR